LLLANSSAIEIVAAHLLAMTIIERLQNLKFIGRWGYSMCQAIDSGMLSHVSARMSSTCFVIITLERYLKVCGEKNVKYSIVCKVIIMCIIIFLVKTRSINIIIMKLKENRLEWE